jgi:pyruvate dehydrogenase E2 component (dihydrolipoamide acetyltransferase)
LNTAGLAGSGPGSRIIERDVAAALHSRAPLTAAAKAAAHGAAVPPFGAGIGGRVTAADMVSGATAEAARAAVPVAARVGAADFPGPVMETPIKGIRKLIADRMYQSLAESAQLTLNGRASAVRVQEVRKRMKESGEALALAKVTVNDLVLFAVSRVLPLFPFMNAHKTGDVLKTFQRVHLGVAVDTPRGLMVPVIRNADLLSLPQISAEAKRLAAAAQGGAIDPGDLAGSTFTVTNLGGLGVMSFTPILNAPEVGILGVCGIALQPLQKPGGADGDPSGGIVFEPQIGFSLTINHQVVDGAPAARFLKALGNAVADIDLYLARG